MTATPSLGLTDPVYTYAVEDLIERAAEIANETGAVIYDALFLAPAEDSDTEMFTADGKLLRALKSTRYASLARPLEQIGNLPR